VVSVTFNIYQCLYEGGVGISISTNIKVANEKRFVWAMPEVFIGIYPDIGASWFLTRFCPSMSVARYIGLTGEKLNAVDAKFSKLVTNIVESEEQFKKLQVDIIQKFKAQNPANIVTDLQIFVSQYERDPSKKPQPRIGKLDIYRRVIDYCFGECHVRNVRDILTNLKYYKEHHPCRCEADIKFVDGILETFKRASPTSLVVTYEALERGKRAETLKEILEMDSVLMANLVTQHDFLEGVRAVLIDRDNKPKFSPPTLDEIDIEKTVQRIFTKQKSSLFQ